jgi:tubulin polyglutamylase TTLL1
VYSTKQVFSADNHYRLGDHQLINHFPNHYELTRKDLVVKNLKRYRKDLQREGRDASVLDFVPTTFVLPGDYALFAEEYRRQPNSTWILKPSARAQGKGIFLINKLSQVRKWYATQWPGAIKVNSSDAYVVSKYIQNPLLIGGKKFDLRLYVCVRSYRPLQAYKSSLCFARFCNYKYTEDEDDLDNAFVHLTNVAVQKHSDSYNENHGSKWPLDSLKFYLKTNYGWEKTKKLFEDIDSLIIHTLKACQAVMINDRHCFELYGYDIIVDDSLKPWLIEVNASPSLSATTHTDRLLKFQLINDTLKCIAPKHWHSK